MTAPRSTTHRPIAACVPAAVLALWPPCSPPSSADGTASAVASSEANAAATWLAGRVQPDGSAIAQPAHPQRERLGSVALSLAMTGTEDAALQRALGYIRRQREAYINEGAVISPAVSGTC